MATNTESLRQNEWNEKVASKIREWLSVYRLSISDGMIAEYMKSLRGFPLESVSTALSRATMENDSSFAPAPGQVRAILLELVEGEKHPALEEMQTWERSDPDWPEVKEFRALLARLKADRSHGPESKADVHTLEPILFVPLREGVQESLTAYLHSQDLDNGLPRSTFEIEAIKAAKGIKTKHRKQRDGHQMRTQGR